MYRIYIDSLYFFKLLSNLCLVFFLAVLVTGRQNMERKNDVYIYTQYINNSDGEKSIHRFKKKKFQSVFYIVSTLIPHPSESCSVSIARFILDIQVELLKLCFKKRHSAIRVIKCVFTNKFTSALQSFSFTFSPCFTVNTNF